METLLEAYTMAKKNNGAPGSDGVTFEVIERQGLDAFLKQIQSELIERTYTPLKAKRQEIPKDDGKVRILSIPAIRDRVVQGALKLILEPIFEADFQSGSFGYRPKRTAHEAMERVAKAIVQRKTLVIDLDLRAYFDTVQHHLLQKKVARRINDDDIMWILTRILKALGSIGVPQGGVITPLTQKRTFIALCCILLGRRFRCFRIADCRRSIYRNRMLDRNQIFSHNDLFDQQPHDLLALTNV
jgi:RNA-directed DNA polymerase